MKHNPFYYLLAWPSGAGGVNFIELDFDSYQERFRMKQKLFSFNGETANVCVVTDEEKFTRQQALKAASCFMEGSYVRIDVNLKDLTSTTTIGQSKTPRH
jgi:hypothetical protein